MDWQLQLTGRMHKKIKRVNYNNHDIGDSNSGPSNQTIKHIPGNDK